jgi:hypothetical protein
MPVCKRCNRHIERFTERRSLRPVSEEISGHSHHGLAFYRYGVCSRNHYTKLEKTRTEWLPCLKCSNRQSERRRYNRAKEKKRRNKSVRHPKRKSSTRRRRKSAPRRNKKVPNFLHKEVYGVSPIVSPDLYSPPPPPPTSPEM